MDLAASCMNVKLILAVSQGSRRSEQRVHALVWKTFNLYPERNASSGGRVGNLNGISGMETNN